MWLLVLPEQTKQMLNKHLCVNDVQNFMYVTTCQAYHTCCSQVVPNWLPALHHNGLL